MERQVVDCPTKGRMAEGKEEERGGRKRKIGCSQDQKLFFRARSAVGGH
jgi:hypothetical protein